jgi:DNA-binding MarR family transcriptional regulator
MERSKILPFWKYFNTEGFLMSAENTTDQFIELMQRFISLRPKLAPPEHVLQFKKKMEKLKSKMGGSGGSLEDRSFLFRIMILLAQSSAPLTMSELSTELNVPMSTATRIVDWLVRGDLVTRVNDPNDRRVVRVGMSKSGSELYETGMTYNKQRIEKLLQNFSSAEQTQLLMLMNKLFDSLASENEGQK